MKEGYEDSSVIYAYYQYTKYFGVEPNTWQQLFEGMRYMEVTGKIEAEIQRYIEAHR